MAIIPNVGGLLPIRPFTARRVYSSRTARTAGNGVIPYRRERRRRPERYGVEKAGQPRAPVQPGLVVPVGERMRGQHPLLIRRGLGERAVPRPVRREAAEHGYREPDAVQLDAILHHHPLPDFDLAVWRPVVASAGHRRLPRAPRMPVSPSLETTAAGYRGGVSSGTDGGVSSRTISGNGPARSSGAAGA